MRKTVSVLVAVLALAAGCGETISGEAGRAATRPPVPCLDRVTVAEYITCLQSSFTALWTREFERSGRTFREPQLTVPDTSRQDEETVDRAFFSPRSGIHFPTRYLDDVRNAFGPRSRVVLAFTLGHENGHHVQLLVAPRRFEGSADLELQADCYAGFWSNQTAIAGEVDATAFRRAAAAELRRLSADPEEVETHGTAEERIRSLERGLAAEQPADCDLGALTWDGDQPQPG